MHTFTGQAFWDVNENCVLDVNDDVLLVNWLLLFENGIDVYYVSTNETGMYTITLPTSDYTITVLESNYLYEMQYECINALFPVDTENTDISIVPIPVRATELCAFLHVDISTNFLSPCTMSTYTVSYCNWGTATANDAYVNVNFGDNLFVFPDAGSGPIPGVHTYELGNIQAGECDNFDILVATTCPDVVGQNYCVEAMIFPDSLCIEPNTNWNGAIVDVDIRCSPNSELELIIRNKGTGDMDEPLNFYIYEDHLILRIGEFQLDSGEELIITENSLLVNYSITLSGFVMLLAEQVTGYPNESYPRASTYPCTMITTSMGENAPFLFNTVFEDDIPPSVSIDCQVGLLDSSVNDYLLTAVPTGVGPTHQINANDDIEYHIRFKNVGVGGIISNITISDTLSTYLDISTLQLGVSSHPYSFNIIENQIMQWQFDNVVMPSNGIGFVKFKVSQQPNNAIGSEIYNNACISFNGIEPVITNSTLHTVSDNFLWVRPVVQTEQQKIMWEISPNPIYSEAKISTANQHVYHQLELFIYTLNGELVQQKYLGAANSCTFNSEEMPNGMYVYQLREKSKKIGTGKIIIQH